MEPTWRSFMDLRSTKYLSPSSSMNIIRPWTWKLSGESWTLYPSEVNGRLHSFKDADDSWEQVRLRLCVVDWSSLSLALLISSRILSWSAWAGCPTRHMLSTSLKVRYHVGAVVSVRSLCRNLWDAQLSAMLRRVLSSRTLSSQWKIGLAGGIHYPRCIENSDCWRGHGASDLKTVKS